MDVGGQSLRDSARRYILLQAAAWCANVRRDYRSAVVFRHRPLVTHASEPPSNEPDACSSTPGSIEVVLSAVRCSRRHRRLHGLKQRTRPDVHNSTPQSRGCLRAAKNAVDLAQGRETTISATRCTRSSRLL